MLGSRSFEELQSEMSPGSELTEQRVRSLDGLVHEAVYTPKYDNRREEEDVKAGLPKPRVVVSSLACKCEHIQVLIENPADEFRLFELTGQITPPGHGRIQLTVDQASDLIELLYDAIERQISKATTPDQTPDDNPF